MLTAHHDDNTSDKGVVGNQDSTNFLCPGRRQVKDAAGENLEHYGYGGIYVGTRRGRFGRAD